MSADTLLRWVNSGAVLLVVLSAMLLLMGRPLSIVMLFVGFFAGRAAVSQADAQRRSHDD